MAKIDISARTPGIFNTNRRKCGWGAALTTCDICGKIMVGHNRGICSKCMRSLDPDRAYTRRGTLPPHFNYKAALRAQAIEDRAYHLAQAAKNENGGTK